MCAFPYILAFTADSIEVRLVINGNLIQAMVMPRLVLISSKSDVFFATTAPEFFTLRPTDRGRNERLDKDISPPSSPHCKSSVSCCKRHAHSPFHLFCLLFFFVSPLCTLLLVSSVNGENHTRRHRKNTIHSASPDGKPFRLYRIQLNNIGSSAGCTDRCATPVAITPPTGRANRRFDSISPKIP